MVTLSLDQAGVEAAADSLYSIGSHYHWWTLPQRRWQELDPIGRDEFLALTQDIVRAYLQQHLAHMPGGEAVADVPGSVRITDTELDAIEARASKATSGPWTSYIERREMMSASSFITTGDNDLYISGGTADDQDFVAAARQDVPRLIDEVRRLRALMLSGPEGIMLPGRVILSVHRGFWGQVPATLRAIQVTFDQSQIDLYCYFDSPVCRNEEQSMWFACASVSADFPHHAVHHHCIVLAPPAPVPDVAGGNYVFRRQEG